MSDRLPQDERLDRRAHVPVPDLDARMAAGRQALARRRAAAVPSWRPAAYAAVASVAVAAATLSIVLLAGERADPVAHVEPGETGGSRFALPDGSTIDADADADVELVTKQRDLVRIALHDGTATFDVTRDPERRFVVVAGDVEVRVIGTRFSVTRTAAEVSVAVTRGLVEVAIGDDVRRLAAGERWSRAVEDDELAAAEPAERGRAAKRVRRRAPRAEPTAEPAPTAADDFEAAVALRREGSAPDAARAFAAFLTEHSSDARAPLAAFELGRLRMDALGDRSGAVTALERAVRTTASAPFRQDALARLVRLYDDLGRTAQCARAREQYLDAYPTGPHAADVRARCESD